MWGFLSRALAARRRLRRRLASQEWVAWCEQLNRVESRFSSMREPTLWERIKLNAITVKDVARALIGK